MPVWDTSPEQRLRYASDHKVVGTTVFQEKEYVLAGRQFISAIRWLVPLEKDLELSEHTVVAVRKLLCACYWNLALCQSKLGQDERVVTSATAVLRLEPSHIKARLKRAEALVHSRRYDEADRDLQVCEAAEPDNTVVAAQRTLLDKLIRDHDSLVASRVRRMFDTK